MFFGFYMNDFFDVIKLSNIEFYVDDIKIYFLFLINDVDLCLCLVVEDFRCVVEWCCVNYLLVNFDKIKLLLFGIR